MLEYIFGFLFQIEHDFYVQKISQFNLVVKSDTLTSSTSSLSDRPINININKLSSGSGSLFADIYTVQPLQNTRAGPDRNLLFARSYKNRRETNLQSNGNELLSDKTCKYKKL